MLILSNFGKRFCSLFFCQPMKTSDGNLGDLWENMQQYLSMSITSCNPFNRPTIPIYICQTQIALILAQYYWANTIDPIPLKNWWKLAVPALIAELHWLSHRGEPREGLRQAVLQKNLSTDSSLEFEAQRTKPQRTQSLESQLKNSKPWETKNKSLRIFSKVREWPHSGRRVFAQHFLILSSSHPIIILSNVIKNNLLKVTFV